MFGNQSRRSVMKWGALGGGAALAQGLLPRPAGAQDVSTLTVGWGTDVNSLDPAQFKSDGAYIVQCNIYDTVVGWGSEPVPGKLGLFLAKPGKFVGGVGESWAYENDGKTLVVKNSPGLEISKRQARQCTRSEISVRSRIAVARVYAAHFPDVAGDHAARSVRGPRRRHFRDQHARAKRHASGRDGVIEQRSARSGHGEGPRHDRRSLGLRLAQAQRRWSWPLSPGQQRARRRGRARSDVRYWRPAPYFKRVVAKYTPNEADRILLLKRKAIDMVVGPNSMSPKNLKSLETEPGLKVVSCRTPTATSSA